ncbi:hypothetical protein K438DRAFT_1990210 [Mycena galopus ATCC 62051]|nr:hypothetical protein K438DRAFT_1990210 [Mycena galopus ATCC 62051]
MLDALRRGKLRRSPAVYIARHCGGPWCSARIFRPPSIARARIWPVAIGLVLIPPTAIACRGCCPPYKKMSDLFSPLSTFPFTPNPRDAWFGELRPYCPPVLPARARRAQRRDQARSCAAVAIPARCRGVWVRRDRSSVVLDVPVAVLAVRAGGAPRC